MPVQESLTQRYMIALSKIYGITIPEYYLMLAEFDLIYYLYKDQALLSEIPRQVSGYNHVSYFFNCLCHNDSYQ